MFSPVKGRGSRIGLLPLFSQSRLASLPSAELCLLPCPMLACSSVVAVRPPACARCKIDFVALFLRCLIFLFRLTSFFLFGAGGERSAKLHNHSQWHLEKAGRIVLCKTVALSGWSTVFCYFYPYRNFIAENQTFFFPSVIVDIRMARKYEREHEHEREH